MDGAGLSQPQPPPPPPHEQQQPPQVDPADPPQQQDNVDREMQDWLTIDEQLGDTYHPQGVVGGGAGDGAGLMVVFSGLEVMENQLD
ncbi:hypothetical protein Scep_016689 [Stephania cephalantha]|uniref:Uncharacterized protein n=1 Tax=Stephania cephalantha TaxID=152367 RepID=A0AAP0IN69_9MAGN